MPASARITVDYRATGTPQPVHDAAVYILDLSSIALGSSIDRISAELRAHMNVLRSNSSSSLILMSHMVPDVGVMRPEEEAMARLRDLSLFQLTNQRLIDMTELSTLVSNVTDSMGRLSVAKKVCSRSGDAAALEVRYQPFSSG